MFRIDTSAPQASSPVIHDWTIRELMAWIAADDARCHDEALRPVLTALTEPRWDDSALRSTSTVALVREVAARLRSEPASGDARVRDVMPASPGGHPQRTPRRAVAPTAAASAPRVRAAEQSRAPR